MHFAQTLALPALAATLALAMAGPARAATVLLAEDFNATTPGLAYPGPTIPGLSTFTLHDIDILGSLNGGPLFPGGCGPANNCVDIAGAFPGHLQSAARFDLLAGHQYQIEVDVSDSAGRDQFLRVELGDFSILLVAPGGSGFVQHTLTYGPVANEAGTRLMLSYGTNITSSNGALVDNVVLSDITPVPEPQAAALWLAGLGGLLAWRHRARAA